MGPSRAHGPSAKPAEANGLPEAHGPPKVHGPRGHSTPCPPLSVALLLHVKQANYSRRCARYAILSKIMTSKKRVDILEIGPNLKKTR